METTKEKIDRALGIMGAKSVDEMLDDMNLESAKDDIDQLGEIEEKISAGFDAINRKAAELTKQDASGTLTITDMNDSLKEVEGLIREAREIFFHVKEGVMSTDLLDSDLIESAAKFLESLHVNINEFVSVYRAKQKFVEKVKLMIFAQEQKKEIMEIKHRHDLELIEAKKKEGEGPEAAEAEGVAFDTDAIVKQLSHGIEAVRFDQDGVPLEERPDEIEKLGAKEEKTQFDK